MLAGEYQSDEPVQQTIGENTENGANAKAKDKGFKKNETLSKVIKYSKSEIESKTIWIEKKLSPSTRWLENLVKPMTSWIERKIQKETPGRKDDIRPTGVPNADIYRPFSSPDDGVMDSNTVSDIAKERVPGQILRIKLLNREPLQYRVKLISRVGEIHILYINAHTGDFILPMSESARD